MIEARLKKSFAARTDSPAFILDVEFRAAAGVTALFGPSGAGKTLTLESIAGFVRPDQGRILLNDRILFDAGANVFLAPQQRRCGYVFQNYALFPHMTLRQNLAFAAARWPRAEQSRRVTEMLDRFRLRELAGRRPHELSGGQKQRCSIARALIPEPAVLLLDEPARGLDAPLRVELYDIIRQVRAEFGTPVLLVTHNLDECFELAEEMIVLDGGRIVQAGTPRQVANEPSNLDVARLLGMYSVVAAEICALDPSRDTSILRIGDHEIGGRYYPAHFKGDRVQMLVATRDVRALPAFGRPQPNQLPAGLLRAITLPDRARLEFDCGLMAEMPLSEWERHKHNREWVLDIPPGAMRVL